MLLFINKKLAWSLPIVVDLLLVALFHQRISNHVQVYSILIGHFRICIQGALSFGISLLITKNVINPATDGLRDILRLESFSEIDNKKVGIVLAPRWEGNIIDR
jgi:hypothetical protein